MNRSGAIFVVCAVILDATGRVLLAQRPLHKHLGGKWEFPGGKVEADETPAAALQRELREELGCEVVVGSALPAVDHDYGNVHITLFPFVCRLTSDSPAPHPHEHTGLQWVEVSALAREDLAPADLPIVAHLRASA